MISRNRNQMPYLVNGQLVTDDRIRAEEMRISRQPQWREIADEPARAKRIRAEAEFAAIDVLIVEQIAATDPRPIDPALVENQVRTQKALGNCRSGFDDRRLREMTAWNLRLQRTAAEMTARAAKPTPAAVEDFYRANRENFRADTPAPSPARAPIPALHAPRFRRRSPSGRASCSSATASRRSPPASAGSRDTCRRLRAPLRPPAAGRPPKTRAPSLPPPATPQSAIHLEMPATFHCRRPLSSAPPAAAPVPPPSAETHRSTARWGSPPA